MLDGQFEIDIFAYGTVVRSFVTFLSFYLSTFVIDFFSAVTHLLFVSKNKGAKLYAGQRRTEYQNTE